MQSHLRGGGKGLDGGIVAALFLEDLAQRPAVERHAAQEVAHRGLEAAGVVETVAHVEGLLPTMLKLPEHLAERAASIPMMTDLVTSKIKNALPAAAAARQCPGARAIGQTRTLIADESVDSRGGGARSPPPTRK